MQLMKNLAFDFSEANVGPLVLDVETQYLSHEVPGGWSAVDKFRIALAVTWDRQHGLRVWYEDDVGQLLAEAVRFAPIVTFNGEGFDFKVLSAYGPVDALYRKSTDILAVLSKRLGFRVKLDSLAQATLGKGKSGSGTESVTWWRSGDAAQRQKVIDYCKMDVELTRDIYLFAQEHGYLLIDDSKQNTRRRVEVSW
jgi:DEAD/DEAH box helicase domain-containing protein